MKKIAALHNRIAAQQNCRYNLYRNTGLARARELRKPGRSQVRNVP
jgi:hypothetical protein